MKTDSEILIEIEHLFENSNWEEAKALLQPLIDREVPAAIRMGASHFNAGLSEEEMDQIYVAGISRAAELGDPEARYILGAWYDVGDYGFEVDQEKASLIFAELAREGDLHCVWINACDHLLGRGAFDKNVELGLSKLREAIELGSAEACSTLAVIYNDGKHGLDPDLAERDRLIALAYELAGEDEYVYDPYKQ